MGSVVGSNNPYARYMTSPSSYYSRRAESDSLPPAWRSDFSEQVSSDSTRRRDSHSSHRHSFHSGYTHKPHSHSSRRSYAPPLVRPDIIDQLDDATGFSYHHEGPYDAARPERNRVSNLSPLDAVKESNEEALRATPRDKIVDCLHSHRPLDGTAFFPPGTTDRDGQVYNYEEGTNMMNEYGNFMRLPGTSMRLTLVKKFTDEDFKNDPFYNRPISNPFTELRRKFSLRRNKKRRSTA
ncbi:hypothetical protein N7470_001225 [Penicillium chermesinum]|nr:hypothetical protein N7470_001225 [Penicillium chermesinum]